MHTIHHNLLLLLLPFLLPSISSILPFLHVFHLSYSYIFRIYPSSFLLNLFLLSHLHFPLLLPPFLSSHSPCLLLIILPFFLTPTFALASLLSLLGPLTPLPQQEESWRSGRARDGGSRKVAELRTVIKQDRLQRN